MKVQFLTSDFPNRFTTEFVDEFNKHYEYGAFVFIASDFDNHEKTDMYFDSIVTLFREKGITFICQSVIDSRLSPSEAVEQISKASVVWICGGDTLLQMNNISAYNLEPTLRNRDGITIGMSAGSINMAKRVVLAKDLSDNVDELSVYEGIGLVDLNIEPHLQDVSLEHLGDIEDARHKGTIIGLDDESFIVVKEGTHKIIGSHKIFHQL